MADNTPVMIPDTSCETVEKSREIDIGRECRRLAIAVSTAIALHSSPTIAQTAPVSPSTSASATADKGGGQVVIIDGVVYTFAKIAGMPEDEQIRLVEKALPKDQERLANYIVSLGQAANQNNQTKLQLEQAANQNNQTKLQLEQVANREGKMLDKQLISKYEQYIANIERGARGDRKTVEQIANAEISPQELKARANALLNRRDIILAGI